LEFDIGFLLEVYLIPGETPAIGRRFTCGIPGIGKGGSAWAAILIYGPRIGIYGIWYASSNFVKVCGPAEP